MTNNKAHKSKRQSKQITIATTFLDSDLAYAIEHLNSGCQFGTAIAADAITARVAPFVVPKDSPGWQSLAIRSANALEAWAKSIREYANLPPSPNHNSRDSVVTPNNSAGFTPAETFEKVPPLQCQENTPQPIIEDEYEEDDEDDDDLAGRVNSQLKEIGLY